MTRALIRSSLFAVTVAITACGSKATFSTTSGTPLNPKIAWPKEDVHDQKDGVIEGFDTGDQKIKGSEQISNRVWVNFEGASLVGDDSRVLRKLEMTGLTVPPFKPSDLGSAFKDDDRAKLIETIMTNLTERFDTINVSFSLTPPEAPYTTLLVGGKNFTPTEHLLGIAPLDVGNFDSSDVAFAMSQEFEKQSTRDALDLLVNVMVHELSHSFGTHHIENDQAVMNPVVMLTTNDLDQRGPYPEQEGEGEENSKEVLQANLGWVAGRESKSTPPEIYTLDAARSGSVGQYSVFSLTNIRQNPDHNLAAFTYEWTFDKLTATGSAIRINFADQEEHTLKLRVKALDSDEVSEVDFIVGQAP